MENEQKKEKQKYRIIRNSEYFVVLNPVQKKPQKDTEANLEQRKKPKNDITDLKK